MIETPSIIDVANQFDDIRVEPNVPDPVLWAEANRILPKEGGSPLPGLWNCSVTPYFREILGRFKPSDENQVIVFCKAAQIGYTVSVLENIIIYTIAADPCPIMYVSATEELLRRRMQTHIQPAIQAAGLGNILQSTAKSGKSRQTGDRVTMKMFPGGHLVGASINSSTDALSMSIKVLLLDEVDAARKSIVEMSKSGDPLQQYMARTKNFAQMGRKIMIGSTPTIEQTSNIWRYYKDGDQRKYFVPCPKCKKMQVLEFQNLIFKDKNGNWEPSKARYRCDHCKFEIRESHKDKMLAKGEWRPTKKAKAFLTTSYHLSSLYSPSVFYSWANMADDFIRAYRSKKYGDLTGMQSFYNNQLGLPWKEQSERPNANLIELTTRATNYKRGDIPKEVIFCTVGVDCQGDRIEFEVLGWCERGISMSIDYIIIPKKEPNEDLFNLLRVGLDEYLDHWHKTDKPRILFTCVDAGYSTGAVYSYCNTTAFAVFAVMGRAAGGVSIPRKNIFSAELVTGMKFPRFTLDVDTLKDIVYKNITLDRTKPIDKSEDWTCFFPSNYPSDYYKQLTAEAKYYKTLPSGHRVPRWIQDYHRNEALDCKVYANAALHISAYNYCVETLKMDSVHWDVFFAAQKKEAAKYFKARDLTRIRRERNDKNNK